MKCSRVKMAKDSVETRLSAERSICGKAKLVMHCECYGEASLQWQMNSYLPYFMKVTLIFR